MLRNLSTLFFALLVLVSQMVSAGALRGVTPDELIDLQKHGALVVDVRTPEEWKSTGIIAGSSTMTYFNKNGEYDKEAWLKQLKGRIKSADQPVVLVCRSGHRSGTVGKELVQESGIGPVYHLEKGIRQWSAESKPLVAP